MIKANFKLPDGTIINIEGTSEEVQKLISFYSSEAAMPARKNLKKGKESNISAGSSNRQSMIGADLTTIVNLIKTCNEAESIEKSILDHTSIVDRTLLPLYIINKYEKNAYGLTSGEIAKVTAELGVPISQPNVATTLSGTASRYIIGDKIRKKGIPVKYKISRRGLQYLQSVISGKDIGK
jgi:hypothetical protein